MLFRHAGLAASARGWCALAIAVLFLAGCASPPTWRKPPAEFARTPAADGALAVLEQAITDRHGVAQSGFTLLERNERALRARLGLIDAARQSIDMQYYVWFGDTVGQLMLLRVLEAADRGVKVRILFDDLNTMLHDMTHVELRDAMLARIDRHPNIEIRVFNAWSDRSLLGRGYDMVTDFERLNRRMHNKQMIVDNRAAIIGGRNLGDEYFGLNPDFNFHDLDVLGVGPVARQASQVFDRYWNSDWVRRIALVTDGVAPESRQAIHDAALATVSAHPAIRGLGTRGGDTADPLAGWLGALAPGSSAVHTDTPARDAKAHNHVPDAFRALMRSARREILITNAYIIPDAHFLNDLRELAGRGVQVRILTNSLASHDVPAVNSHYQSWRRPILESGAQLFELRPDAALRAEAVELPPTDARFVGLHTKAMVIDRERAFVGSMNLDPRSEIVNSEMGVIIHSPALAEDLTRRMLQDMTPANSWQVVLAEDGGLRWRSDAGDVARQPARNFWQRVEDVFFKLFPPNLY
jgi:putative cardiolipin synthase